MPIEERDEYGRLMVKPERVPEGFFPRGPARTYIDPAITNPPKIQLKRLHPEAALPFRATPDSAGWDLSACLISESGRPLTRLVSSRTTVSIPTGWALTPPKGFVTLVLSRSGMAAANPSIFVANSPGLIDPDYTGEINVLLFNGGFNAEYIKHGQRIAQLLFIPLCVFPFIEVADLPPSERGSAGFGSSGS